MKHAFLSLLLIGVTSTIAVLLLAFSPSPAYACSCLKPTPARSLEQADVVGIGKVLHGHTSELVTTSRGTSDVLIEVERYLKGSGYTELLINDEESDCRYFGSFGNIEQQSVLVFLRGDSEPYRTSLCSGNQIVGDRSSRAFIREVEAITGPGVPPMDAELAPVSSSGGLGVIAGVVAGATLLFGGALGLRERFGRGKS